MSTLRVLCLAAAAALPACSHDKPGTPPPDGGGGVADPTLFYRSGSRLRARVIQGDGLPVFETFVDTQKNLDCDFRETADGALRCLPSQVTGVGFLDDQCTMPAAVVDDCTAGFGFAQVDERTSGCGVTIRAAELRPIEASLPAAPYWDKQADGQCVMQTLGPGQQLRGVGAPVPLTDFVAGHTVDEAPIASLRRRRVVGDDGSELALPELTDAARDAPCQADRLAPPDTPLSIPTTLYCAPEAVAYADAQYGPFTDASCTELAASDARPASCPAPVAVMRYDAPKNRNCAAAYGHQLFELGAPLSAPYRLAGASCMPAGGSATTYDIGPAFDLLSLPAMERGPLGTGRVRPFAVTAAGVQLDHGDLWDDTAQATCTAQPFDDGKLYCVPAGTITNPPLNFYKDAGCTQPILVVLDMGCAPPPYVVTGNLTCNGGAYASMVQPVGAALAITEYYQDNGGCSPTPTPLGTSFAFDLSPAVAVSTVFAEVTRTVE